LVRAIIDQSKERPRLSPGGCGIATVVTHSSETGIEDSSRVVPLQTEHAMAADRGGMRQVIL
jgi:hypothetical protein